MTDLYKKIDDNRVKLDGCSRHHFPNLGAIEFGGKAQCSKCFGELSLRGINQYVRGYEAAGKSGNDIVPGWKDETPTRRFFKGPAQ